MEKIARGNIGGNPILPRVNSIDGSLWRKWYACLARLRAVGGIWLCGHSLLYLYNIGKADLVDNATSDKPADAHGDLSCGPGT